MVYLTIFNANFWHHRCKYDPEYQMNGTHEKVNDHIIDSCFFFRK